MARSTSKMPADHFENVAQYYGEFRPKYPLRLFETIVKEAPSRQHCWDCATGSGQAAVALAEMFESVTATDASTSQLENSEAHDRVVYRVAPAESSGLRAESVDLITVAQALHWFPLDAFFQECQRVLKPGGILAIWSYGLLTTNEEKLDQLIQHYFSKIVGPYWPPERSLVDECYRSVRLPFDELDIGELKENPLAIKEEWSLVQMKGYLRSWSASGYYLKALGKDPLENISEKLDTAWGVQSEYRTINWTLTLRLAKKP